MSPLRAFFVSFTAGLAILIAGHATLVAALAEPPTERVAAA